MLADIQKAALVVVDMQPNFLAAIPDGEAVLARTLYLVRCATTLEIPVFVTEQYPSRMGGTDPRIAEALPTGADIAGKMIFSAWPALRAWLPADRSQLVIAGIETPICVNQTAHEALAAGLEVFVVEDAVGARSDAMHRNGLERMRAAGAEIAHSDSIVYEWMKSAEHPAFRDILKLVKES